MSSLPLWDGSGSLLIYSAQRKDNFGIHVKAADGSGERKTLVPDNNSLFQVPYAWSQREQSVLFEFSVQDPYRTGIGKVAIDGRAEATPVLPNAGHPSLSPDENWIAFLVAGQVFIRPYPEVEDGLWQVSLQGGQQPTWSKDGTSLYYLAANHMMEARITIDSASRWRSLSSRSMASHHSKTMTWPPMGGFS